MAVSLAAFVLVVRGRADLPPPSPDITPAVLAAYDSLGLGRIRGAPTARDTLLEVTDFLCPACAQAHRSLEPVIDSLVRQGSLVHRVMEVPFQMGSTAVSVAGACSWVADPAGYWRYRRILFEAQRTVAAAYPVNLELVRLAQYAGIDSTTLRQCIERDSAALAGRFAEALRLARLSSVEYTPAFTLNGAPVAWSSLAERLRHGR